MNRIIVVANMTSLRVFRVDPDTTGNDRPFSGISEIKRETAKIRPNWNLENYISELGSMVNAAVQENLVDSWVFVIPFNLMKQVLPLLDDSVGERIEEVMMDDLVALSPDQISQVLADSGLMLA